MSSPGSPSWARASATSWRSPTDRFSPRSPTSVSSPPGRRRATSRARAARRRARSRRRSRPVRPRRTLSRDRRVEQEAVLGHHADRGGDVIRRSTSRRSTPPMRDLRPRWGRRAGTGAWRTWSCPNPSRRRPRRARRPARSRSMPRSTVAPARYANPTSVEVDRRARPRGERDAVGGLDDVDRRVEHAEDLAPAGDRGLGLVEDLAQLRDRDEQQVHEEHERDQLAEVEPPVGAVDAPTPRRWPARAMAPKRSASGNITANHFAARIWARYCVRMRVAQSHPSAAPAARRRARPGRRVTSSDTSESVPPTRVRTSS